MTTQGTQTFDYIVAGAGAAGCVIAARLSEDSNVNVLLLEAGGDDTFFTNTRFLDLASLFSLWTPATDWGYVTEPAPGANGRGIPITQGKVLGGGSSTNGRIFLRGNRRDYDGWAAMGNTGWGYNDVLPYFKKYENYNGPDSEYHGKGGPVSVIDLPSPTPIAQAFMQSAIDHGFNGPADVNGAKQENSVAYCQSTTTPELERASTAVAYIKPIRGVRKNFTLETEAQVTRILFEGTRAVGVEYVQNGQTKQARASSEVICSFGGFNEPKMLMQSGIGPADHLKQMGIPVVADLPGVGQNLQDHLLVRMSWHLKQKQPSLIILSEVNLFTYAMAPETASPDLQYMFAPFFFPEYGALEDGITLVPVIAQPESTGTVRLRSNNPMDPPVISMNYLAVQKDVDVLLRGIELGYELMDSKHLEPFKGEEVVPGVARGDKAAMEKYVRDTAVTVWHPSCTCRMGTDDMAVVDPTLRVRGVQGLRVADCSVMPKIVNANLQATVIMIGEKAADMIKSGK